GRSARNGAPTGGSGALPARPGDRPSGRRGRLRSLAALRWEGLAGRPRDRLRLPRLRLRRADRGPRSSPSPGGWPVMRIRLLIAVVLLSGCASGTPSPAPSLPASAEPTPTPVPTEQPTATPIPLDEA